MVTIPTFDPYLFLVGRKFPAVPPSYLFGKVPPRQMSPSSVKAEEVERWRFRASEYIEELKAMPKEQFNQLLELEQKNYQDEILQKERDKEAERFFNLPHAAADFDHWSRAAHWTLEEAVALCFGKNPEVVNSKRLQPLVHESAFAERYCKLLDLARRAVAWEKLFDPVVPGIFIAWARLNEIEFPQYLVELVKRRGNDIVSWKIYMINM